MQCVRRDLLAKISTTAASRVFIPASFSTSVLWFKYATRTVVQTSYRKNGDPRAVYCGCVVHAWNTRARDVTVTCHIWHASTHMTKTAICACAQQHRNVHTGNLAGNLFRPHARAKFKQ